MQGSRVFGFVKFFPNEAFADEFIGGGLYMKRLSYFKGLEEAGDAARGDPHEATAAWYQPKGLEITFSEHPELKITDKDLAAPVSIAYNAHNHMYLFCMCTLLMENPATYGEISREDAEERLKVSTLLDDRCLTDFGPVAVVVQPNKFIEQLKKVAAVSGLRIRTGLVDYYDETTFSGRFDYKEIPFKKQSRYAYQKEFRISIDTKTPGDDVLRFQLGELSAFCAKMPAADVNNAFQVNVSERS